MAGLRDADAGARQVGFEDGRRGVSRPVGHRPGIQHQGSAATRKSRAVAAPRSARFPREQLSVQDSCSKTAGNGGQNMPMLQGSKTGRSLPGKPFTFDSHQPQSRPRQQARQRRGCRHGPAAPTNNGPIADRSQQRHHRRGPGLVFRTLRRPVWRLVRGSEGAGQGATHGRGRSEN